MAERFVPIQLVLDTAQALSKARGFVSVLAGIGSGKVKNDFNQLASETQKTGAAFNDASAKAKTYRDSLGRLRDEFGRFASDGKRSFDQVERQAAKSAGGIKGAFNSVFGSVSSDASKFGSILKKAFSFTIAGIGIATLATATTAAFSSLISTGIKFNSTIETSQLGIASLIASVAQLNNSDGIQLKGIDKLNAAIPLAEEQIKKLRIAGLETAATTEQLVEAFQQAVGPGLAAGLGLDQVRQLTIDITQAAGALGVPMAQLSQEVRTILEGTIDQNARIAKALGLTNEMVRNWRAQGVLADQLNRKLEVFRASGERVSKTFAGATSNLEEAVQLLAGSATDKFFKEVTEDVIRFTARLIDLQNLDVSKELKPGVEAIDESLTYALQKLDNFVNDGLDLFIKLSDQIADSKTELASLTDNVDGLIRQLAGLASQVLPFDSFKSAIAAVNEELEKARVDIALLQDAGELTGNLLAGVVKALALVIEKSIQQALGVVGISIRALDEDILRLTKDLAEINVRLEQGAINAARVTNEILAAKAGAGFVSSPARGDFRTDLNRRDFGAELRGPASATPASGNTLLTTNKPRGGTGGGGGRRSREVSELEQLSKQIKDAEKDLKSLLDTGSKEFQLKIKLDDVKALNSSLDDLRKLQRETGLFSDVKGLQRLDAKGSVNVGETQKAVSGEIARQKAFQETLKFSRTKIAIPREAIDALDFTRPIVQQFTELNKIIEETNPEAAEFVLNAFLLSDRFKLLREQGGPLVEGLKELAKQLQGMAELDAQQVALKGFEERISSLKESLRGLTETERLFEEIKRSKLSPEDQRRLLGQLGEVQQIEEFKRQEERAQQTAQRVGDFFTEAFRDSFQRGPKAFWDRTEQAAKETLARIGADIFKNLVLRFLNLPTGGGGGFGIGGGQQSSGGNFLGNIFNGILNPGGGSFGNILGPGGTPPFLPSSSSAGGSSGSGFKGILNNLLGFNLFKSAGTAAGVPLGTSGFSTTSGSLTSLHELGHAGAASAAAPSALAGLGATGLLAGGGILGSLLGGDSKAGKLLGFGGGTALAGFAGASGLFGGGIAGALPALFSNPFTAIIGGALLGGALLFNLFGNRDLKKLRKTISSEYAVDVKDKNVLKQIKEIGKGVFGKTWEDRMRDVVRLEASKEIIAAYAEGTRQNAKGLVLEKELLDPNNKRNQFIRQIEPVKRISGGIIPGVTRGFDHIVALMDGGEGVLTSRTTARIGGAGAVDALNAGRADVVPRNIQQAQPGIIGMPAGLLQALINAIAQFQSIPPGHLLINAMNENPGAVANANDEGMKRSGSLMAISVQRLAGGYQ